MNFSIFIFYFFNFFIFFNFFFISYSEAKRTLPRPKVGDFCSTAMEQGFSDACVPLCMEQPAIPRVAETCRAAAIEMPRPTVRRWCEYGYNTAFQKTMRDLYNHFTSSINLPIVNVEEIAGADLETEEEQSLINNNNNNNNNHNHNNQLLESDPTASIYTTDSNVLSTPTTSRTIVASIPVTLENDETRVLLVYEGQDAEEAVVEFCREHLPSEVSTCIKHLLQEVVDKLTELEK
jgi:hypothetical protein